MTGGGEYKHITSLGPVSEKSQDLGTISGAVTIDLSAGLSVIATVGGATTLAFANAPAGGTATVLLRLTNGGAYTVTWPSTIKWPGDTALTLTDSGTDLDYSLPQATAGQRGGESSIPGTRGRP